MSPPNRKDILDAEIDRAMRSLRPAARRGRFQRLRALHGRAQAIRAVEWGLQFRYVWIQTIGPYVTGYQREAGVHGFCNRGARKAAQRARKSKTLTY